MEKKSKLTHETSRGITVKTDNEKPVSGTLILKENYRSMQKGKGSILYTPEEIDIMMEIVFGIRRRKKMKD